MHDDDPTLPDPVDDAGVGPLFGSEPDTGRPIDDPALADNANPRWDDPDAPKPDAQTLINTDGTPNVMPPRELSVPIADASQREHGTPEDQAARPIGSEVGSDNIAEGRGGGATNPALAEGGSG